MKSNSYLKADEASCSGIVLQMKPITEIGEGIYMINSQKINTLFILWLN